MKKYLFLYAVLITALLAYGYTRYRHETRRLTQNQNALASGIEHYLSLIHISEPTRP